MNIAIIPARGGSKRIPRKNIKIFANKPMIAHAITAAKASGLFEHIIVSTEDDEIAEIARLWGADTPFKRPINLADDLAPTVPVIAHAVRACINLGWSVSYACCIYPCSPFISPDDLTTTFSEVRAHNADFIYPVTEFAHPIQRAMRRLPSGGMEYIIPESELTRTQDFENTYHDTGQFYWGKASAWLEQKKMHSAGLGYPIPNWRVVDIDTLDDWKRAELLFSSIYNSTMYNR
ncbi:pseudaminic acid cytidylyltransferase [Gammaproteobacteria bacterium]|nr:pseudaminic acid cytidylyltransferase [Gammaproteobacteria bacterium]MDC1015483.1 pseudaminic acid cytidylyltransferase [Gammaproteobacteria bacterium]